VPTAQRLPVPPQIFFLNESGKRLNDKTEIDGPFNAGQLCSIERSAAELSLR
jgi:hypothetical protein